MNAEQRKICTNTTESSPERILDVDVPVQRNRAQIEYARRGAHHIECDPCVAETRPKDPVAQQVVHAGEGHHQRGDEEVSDGQRGQEEVADAAEAAIRVDGDADQDVAGH